MIPPFRRWGLLALTLTSSSLASGPPADIEPRPHLAIRGIYGGVPTQILEKGQRLADHGVNAVWIGSGGLSRERIDMLRAQGAKVFAEFNTMHVAAYLKDHPDAAPIGVDGRPCPPPEGWQGICPTHPGYRAARMEAFRQALADFPIDGIWLDYHHAHASWERFPPLLPDTCFCDRCLDRFQTDTGVRLPNANTAERARRLLAPLKNDWVNWRCGLFTDWVRQFRQIRDEVRPGALLGTFHCPWSDTDFNGALRDKLAIDLKAQAPYFDVLSPMPYHARFGHADDPAWISRQTTWLGRHLGLEGKTGERLKIWPIVQLADWGETVPVSQVPEVLDHGTRLPATGVMVFHWSGVGSNWDKAEAMGRSYQALSGAKPPPR
jgi:hypothetical protein